MPRILLTEEEKTKKRYDYNQIQYVKEKREAINSQQYFCLGCESFYGYTHKKRHYEGYNHENRMKILKSKNIEHIEKHIHEESNRKDKPKDYKYKHLFDENYRESHMPYNDKWYEGVIDCSKMNTN
jgi:uncharacterized protein (UPF0371 family)